MSTKSYPQDVPTPPGYPAPTPHAAVAAQEPFRAPAGPPSVVDGSFDLGEATSAGEGLPRGADVT